MDTNCANCTHLVQLDPPVTTPQRSYPVKCVVGQPRPNLMVGSGASRRVPREDAGDDAIDAASDLLLTLPEYVTCGLFSPK